MSLALTFMIPPTRNVKTRVFTDPTQYDTEVNAARGFSKPSIRKSKHQTSTFEARVAPAREAVGGIPPVIRVMDDFSRLNKVTEREVIEAQNFWGQSIVDISNCFLSGENYVDLASERASQLYGYDHSNVLFKPTKASDQPFRPTANDALSYFVGHDAVISGFKEDQGFAINAKKGFSKVIFKNHQIDCHNEVAHAMGTYEFTCATTGEVSEVEYTFGYKRNKDGNVRICLHHSSIPYTSGNMTTHTKPVESRVKRKIVVDPSQFDVDENDIRHVSIGVESQ